MKALFFAFVLLLLVASTFACSWLHNIRSNRVSRFRIGIIKLADRSSDKRIDENRDDWEEPLQLIDKHDYERMVFSFKPLKLKYWFTEDEIKILKGEK